MPSNSLFVDASILTKIHLQDWLLPLLKTYNLLRRNENQVSYYTEADKMRRCALQGRNCKDMHESILQILGDFRPIWNTMAISNKGRSCSAPQSPHPIAPCRIGDTWMQVPPFPSALTVALHPFFLSFFLSFLPLSVSATIQVNTQDTTDFSRVNPALSWECKTPKAQGKLVISTPAGAEPSMGEHCGCLLAYYKSYRGKGLFLYFSWALAEQSTLQSAEHSHWWQVKRESQEGALAPTNSENPITNTKCGKSTF